MPFFRSGSGGTPGRILNLSEKRSGTACRSGTDRAGHTDAIYNRTRAIPSAASHARTGTRPTVTSHARTGPHPAARNYSSTGNDPTAENTPSTRSSPAATSLLSESRNSGYPKASKTLEMNGEKQQFLGIPGIYEQPERMMAMLFGFPEFEAAAAVSSDSKDMTGVFGYWMCPLNQD